MQEYSKIPILSESEKLMNMIQYLFDLDDIITNPNANIKEFHKAIRLKRKTFKNFNRPHVDKSIFLIEEVETKLEKTGSKLYNNEIKQAIETTEERILYLFCEMQKNRPNSSPKELSECRITINNHFFIKDFFHTQKRILIKLLIWQNRYNEVRDIMKVNNNVAFWNVIYEMANKGHKNNIAKFFDNHYKKEYLPNWIISNIKNT